jgi:tetratricopeptide (TPR) repeat protein
MRPTGGATRLGVTSLALLCVVTFSCSKGYNRHADEYYAQGMIFYDNMDYERSIDSFSKVLELAPAGEENDRVFYMRGLAYSRTRQYDKAVYDFTRALEMTGTGEHDLRFLIHEMRGDAYSGRKNWPMAILDYSKAIAEDPDHKNAKLVYLNRAWAYLYSEEAEAAIRDFDRAISHDAKMADAYYGRGIAWLRKGDSPRASTDAREALRLMPQEKRYDDLVYETSTGTKRQ